MRAGSTWSYGDHVQVVESGQRLWAWGGRLPVWVLDAALAAVLMAPVIVSVVTVPENGAGYKPINAGGIVLAITVVVSMAWRRTFPWQVFLVQTVCIIMFAAADYNLGALPVVTVISSYTVGGYCRPRQIAVIAIILVASLTGLWIVGIPDFTAGDVISNVALYGAALGVGWAVQSRRLRLEAAEERAELLEREQNEERARAVAQERLHIAQELHDVMAHSMSVIAVQAGAGMHVVDQDPAEAKRALENISATSRSTLAELRRLLGVLRDDDGADYAPAPSLADIDHLAREVTDAGVPVEIQADGPLDVPAGVGFTGYRVVQEALTNVLKHAGPSRAWVRLADRDGTLRIEVRDDGRGVNGRAPGTGHGLVGMRERVAVYGGTLDAGPIPGGGYLLVADLPYGR
jgi:signal transduction histidine kinase